MRPVSTGELAPRRTRLALRQTLIAIGGIYTAQSLVGSLTFLGVPAILRANGSALDTIGLVSLAMLPWALKFLWAPAVERYRLPRDHQRRSRRIVIAGEVIVAAALLLLAWSGPVARPSLFAILGVMALASATVDIACDAFAIEQLAPESRGWGNTAQVGGGYLGIVLGSGLFVVLAARTDWPTATVTMAALLGALAVPFAMVREPARPPSADISHRPRLGFALARPEVRWGLMITVLFESGVRLAHGMVSPFLIDARIDLAVIGMLNGLGGAAAGIAGTVIGGLLVTRLGARRAVLCGALAQAAALCTLVAAAIQGTASPAVLAGLVVANTAATAIGFVALYALLMGLSSLLQAGVDFTLFQCADALTAGLLGFLGSVVAQHFGYGTCFGAAALLGLASCALLPFVLRRIPSTRSASTT